MAIAMIFTAIAGVLMAIRTTFDPAAGPTRLIFAFEAVIIGGLGSLWGTLARRHGAGHRAVGRLGAVAELADPRRPHRLSRHSRAAAERVLSADEGLMAARSTRRALDPREPRFRRAAAAGASSRWRRCLIGAGAGTMRLVSEMAYYLALAQLWNLLAGYAGLVSVGQQAYVGIGGYALFYLTSELGMHPLLAVALAGPVAARDLAAGGARRVPAARRLFRGRHLGRRRGLPAGRQPDPSPGRGSGMSLTPAIVRQIAPDRAGARHHRLLGVARRSSRSCARWFICCCARAMGWR